MIVLIKKIVFSSILIVILLHTFIPHNQTNKKNSSSKFIYIYDNESIIDLFRFVFHEDRNGNLDNLSSDNSVSDYSFIDLNVNFFLNKCFYLTLVDNVTPKIQLYTESNIYSEYLIVDNNYLRGPPIFF